MKLARVPDVVVLLAAISLVGATGLAREPAQLIPNGGFEDGLEGWKPAPQHRLVDGEATARSGKRCLSGEVTKPQQALFLRRTVRVRASNRYLFEVWARATNRTKLVLWVTQPGAKSREMVASWSKVPGKWTRYTTPLDALADGALELQIVAPSSHGEPAGRIWIDDISLIETELPPTVRVSGDGVSAAEGFHDEPAMAATADGSVWVAWNAFQGGADSVQLARYEVRDANAAAPSVPAFSRRGSWQLAGGEGTYALGVEVTPTSDDGAAVLWATEVDRNWDLRAALCSPGGPGKTVALTTHEAVDVKPTAAWHDGTLWVAWESNREGARRAIFVTSVRDGDGDSDVTEPTRLSSLSASSYDPTMTVLASGEVCVAWHAFRENNFDVYLRRRSVSGSWGPETRLTRAPTVDRHARLFSRGDELWLLYENAATQEYRIGTTNRRQLVIARVVSEGLLAPQHAGRSPLDGRCEAGDAAFDTAGRLWVSFLQPRLPRAGWDAFVTCLADGGWQKPTAVTTRKGMDRRPSLALVRGHPIVALQADTLPNSWSDVDLTSKARSDVFLARVPVDAPPPSAGIAIAPLVESDVPFEAAALRVARGEDTPTPKIEYESRPLKLYFGDLHEHTDISVCNRVGDQSVNESYQHMRDIARHDFACVTDHGYNINPYLWAYTAKMARVNDDPDRFLTFLAEEWTSSFEKYDEAHPFGYYGHRNLILSDLYFPRWWNARNGQTPAQVWEELRAMNADFVHIPHQLADTGNVPTDWDFADEKAQPVAEIFQVRGSYEHKGTPREAGRSTPEPGYFLQDAWARGIVIGVIASPDHGGGYGKACVWAPELTREAILAAIRARHCYGTTGAKIVLDVRVDGHLMGEKVAAKPKDLVKIDVRVRCPGEIERVEVCRSNRFIYTRTPGGREAEFSFVDRDPLPGRSYYYVRVVQKDEEIAWSSPVWLGAR